MTLYLLAMNKINILSISTIMADSQSSKPSSLVEIIRMFFPKLFYLNVAKTSTQQFLSHIESFI